MMDRTEETRVWRRLGRIERLLLRVLDLDEEILMDETAAIALLEAATALIGTLETEAADSLDNPAVQSALTDLKAAVDAAAPASPADPGDGSTPVDGGTTTDPGDGTPSAGDSSDGAASA